MGECVYAIGGHHNYKNVLEIEELDTKSHKGKLFKKNGWKVIVKIPEHISLRSAPCLAYKDEIYIIGESMSSPENKPCLAVLVFSPNDRSIRVVAEFPKKCSDCKAILHDKNIYIASSEGYFLKLDIVSNIFSSCSDLITKETNITMYSDGNMIYTEYKEDRRLFCINLLILACCSSLPQRDTRIQNIRAVIRTVEECPTESRRSF
ncbi:unnamed protein product [Mytilus edulis]|uniref:Uncharacterized protein n=1 Tax=Mytilus edulis TaxID=6550 RepID=A0A8S3TRT3_MYTED|nr:unnamed protein product [Mytilus edulis]